MPRPARAAQDIRETRHVDASLILLPVGIDSPDRGCEEQIRPLRIEQLAISLQRTGSAYLSALGELASLPESDMSDETRQSREVALVALCAAARQTAEIVPSNRLANQLLFALDVQDDWTARERGKIRTRVISF